MSASKILIMGLPGAGKTYLATELKKLLEANGKTVTWFNADEIRKQFNDWDFSEAGRIRQSKRMSELSATCNTDYALCDFVAPLVEMRNNFKADWTVWMDTIREGRYADTNKMFVEPEVYDFRITEQNAAKWADFIAEHIVDDRRRPTFDWKKETVQMLGRWQPWHDGHRALFERLLQRTGQVMIQVRDVQGWQGSNPLYDIQVVPNIVHIGWGRGVGYSAGEETFDESITDISATKIRKELGLK